MTDTPDQTASDIPTGTWVDQRAPAAIRPYLRLARLDRPIGTWLLLFPCWWGMALATPGWPDPWFAVLFAIGAVVMRGAGCTLNDIADRDYDGRVARTADRPIPSGAVSVGQAAALMVALSLIGLAVLLQFNGFAVAVGAGSLIVVAIYPFMKRITYWPQVVLGLAFNWGALLGWAAVRGDLGWPAVTLYAAGIFWTLGYDTIYAHQDKEDDLMVGIKSTALKLGASTRPWLYFFFTATVVLLAHAGTLAGLGWPFYVLLAAGAAHMGWQAVTVDLDAPRECLAKFKSNRHVGWIILGAIVAGQVTRQVAGLG